MAKHQGRRIGDVRDLFLSDKPTVNDSNTTSVQSSTDRGNFSFENVNLSTKPSPSFREKNTFEKDNVLFSNKNLKNDAIDSETLKRSESTDENLLADFDVTAFISSFQAGLTKSNPLLDATHTSLDAESVASSGIGSGTDDEPDRSKQIKVVTSYVSHNTDQSNEKDENKQIKKNIDSSSSITDEIGDYEESEMSLYFDEEEEDSLMKGKQIKVYEEYKGEDFSQYLIDDEYHNPHSKSNIKPKRHKNSKRELAVVTTTSSKSPACNENYVKAGIKKKLSRAFSIKGRSKSDGDSGSIQEFSYTDSKIGSHSHAPVQHSNQKDKNSTGRQWWNLDTLSARKLNNVGDVFLKARKYSYSASPDGFSEPCSYNKTQEINFESSRKESLYDSRINKSKSKSNLFGKLYKSLRKSDSELDVLSGNTIINPISEHADVYL